MRFGIGSSLLHAGAPPRITASCFPSGRTATRTPGFHNPRVEATISVPRQNTDIYAVPGRNSCDPAASQGRDRHTVLVSRIGIFGSVARGEQTEASDIDILVDFSRPIGFFTFLELEEFLSLNLSAPVDLVTSDALKPVIRERVTAEVAYV